MLLKLVKSLSFLVTMALPLVSFSQNGLTNHAGARGMAMGNASVIFQDINSLFSNQAGLVGMEKASTTLFTEQRFELSEIRSFAAGFAYPTKSGTFGLQVQYFGFQEYNEQKLGIAYARKLLENLSLGAQVNYINFRIPEYGNNDFASVEIGLQYQILKDLLVGVHLANPIGQEVVESEELPTVFKLGLAYSPSKKVTLTFEAEEDIDFITRLKGGVEYQLVESFALRLGFASNPSIFSFGAGYVIREKVSIDIGTTYHQTLGFSPGLGINFNF